MGEGQPITPDIVLPAEGLHPYEVLFERIIGNYHTTGKEFNLASALQSIDPSYIEAIRMGVVETLPDFIRNEEQRLGTLVEEDDARYIERVLEFNAKFKIGEEQFRQLGRWLRLPGRSEFSKEVGEVSSHKALLIVRLHEIDRVSDEELAQAVGWKPASAKAGIRDWSDKGERYIAGMIVAGKTTEAQALRELTLSVLPNDAPMSLTIREQTLRERLEDHTITKDEIAEKPLNELPIHPEIIRLYQEAGALTAEDFIKSKLQLRGENSRWKDKAHRSMLYLAELLGKPRPEWPFHYESPWGKDY